MLGGVRLMRKKLRNYNPEELRDLLESLEESLKNGSLNPEEVYDTLIEAGYSEERAIFLINSSKTNFFPNDWKDEKDIRNRNKENSEKIKELTDCLESVKLEIQNIEKGYILAPGKVRILEKQCRILESRITSLEGGRNE